MKRYPRPLTGLFSLLTAFFILFNSPVPADEGAGRVLILPLTIHSEKDLTFLNKGIMEMLASRISQSAEVIRSDAPRPGKDPVQTARDLDANYVVTGSLTVFGDSVSTDAALTSVETGDAALQFSQFGHSSSDVLMHIDQFATQVSRHLAAISATPAVAAPTDAAPAVMIPQVTPKVEPVQPVQPAAVPVPLPPTAPTTVAVAAAAPATAVPEVAANETVEALWTSSPYKGVISALTTGDVNGDGRPDIVYLHADQIVVERFDGGRLDRLALFDAGGSHKILAVDAGDINGNQVAEIFVTRLNVHGKLDSVVLEWNGSALQATAGGQPWYFRVGNDPQKGLILMGQRRGASTASDTGGLYEDSHFLPGVFELAWNGRDYQAGPRVTLPGDMTVYRFARGDLFNDGTLRTIAYSADDELRIFDPSGDARWAGKETYGGNPLFLETGSSTDVRTTDRTYLTQRIVIADLDQDGKNEVVTVHNRDAARGFVEKFRQYTRGRMIALFWNKVNMKEVWSGEEVGGYISDFSLADLDHDGRLEAVYAMVASTGLTRSKTSNIVVEQIGELSGK